MHGLEIALGTDEDGKDKMALDILVKGLPEPVKGKMADAYFWFGSKLAKELGQTKDAMKFQARLER